VKWTHAPLSTLADFDPRGPRSGQLPSAELVDFLPMSSVDAEQLTARASEQKPVGDLLSGFTYFQTGDVLVAKITPCFENGKIVEARLTTKHGFGTTEFHVIRAHSKRLDSKYLTHFLRQPFVRLEGQRRMTGSAGQRRVPRDFLKELDIPLPPVEEQRRIAAILDRADALRKKRSLALQKLDSLTQSIFLDMFGEPRTNPKGWPIGTIEDLVSDPKRHVRCGPFGTQLKAAEITTEGVPLFGIETAVRNEFNPNVKKFVTSEKSRDLRAFDAASGDVLVTRMGTIGKACVVPEDFPASRFSYHLFRIRPDPQKCLSEFLAATISKSGIFLRQLQDKAHGAIMDGLSTQDLRSVRFPIPTIGMQSEFVRRVRAIDEMKRRSGSEPGVDDLFASLQQLAFRGEL